MKKPISLFLFFLIFPLCISAQEISQEVISSSGYYSEGSSGQLSWTLGDLAVETYSTEEVSLTQGFQQPFYEVTTAFENLECNFLIQVYPVPSSDFITVEFNELQNNLKVILYNLQGEIILIQQVESKTITLDLNNLSPSEYILKILNNENILLKSYKIVKH
jgi:hypothetical protein